MLPRILTISILLIFPTLVLAHGSHGNGVMAGFTHPILGLDHNIAILGIGILGYLLDKKKWFLAPFVFIAAMIVGGFMGVEKEATFFIEKVIAFSVFTIGWMIAFHSKLNLGLILLLAGIFGGFHGFAHGAEMDPSNTVFKYIPGFSLGAILLASIGALISKFVFGKNKKQVFSYLAGGIVIGCGVMMLLG